MKARITIDGINVLETESKESLRVRLGKIAKTANPFAKTSVDAVAEFKNPELSADNLLAMGTAESEVKFYEIPEGKTAENLTAEYTLGNFSNRIKVISHAAEYVGTIHAEKSAKKDDGGKVEQDSDI